MESNPFAGKKITIIGLGLLGGALNDAIFLAEHGAIPTITDLKSAEELKPSIDRLKSLPAYELISFHLGEHQLEDFSSADLILQPGNVPLDSPYLAEARKNNIPVHVSESLFFANLPEGVKTVGVTGTRGKSTTARLIYEILEKTVRPIRQVHDKQAQGSRKNSVFLAGNTKGVSTLALLDLVKAGDTVVMELDSWALHSLGEIGHSPEVAIFTNFMVDHQNFYRSMDAYFADKAQIFLHQRPGGIFICGSAVLETVNKKFPDQARRAILPKELPGDWQVKLLGEHNRRNVEIAVQAAKEMGVGEEVIRAAVESFGGVPGRLELVAEKGGIRYYNDTTATTPEAALAALKALRTAVPEGGGIVLIGGGADKALEVGDYVKEVKSGVKALILFKGSATEKILAQLQITNYELRMEIRNSEAKFPIVVVDNMKDAVEMARKYATAGDIILLSPGAASFGIFKNEFDRGEQFNNLVSSIQ